MYIKSIIFSILLLLLFEPLLTEPMYILDHLEKDGSDKWNLVFKDKDGKEIVQKSEGNQFCMSKLAFIKINRSGGENPEIESVVIGLQDRNEKMWSVYLFGDYVKETSPNRIKIIKKDKLYFDKKNPKSLKRFDRSSPPDHKAAPFKPMGGSIPKRFERKVAKISAVSGRINDYEE